MGIVYNISFMNLRAGLNSGHPWSLNCNVHNTTWTEIPKFDYKDHVVTVIKKKLVQKEVSNYLI